MNLKHAFILKFLWFHDKRLAKQSHFQKSINIQSAATAYYHKIIKGLELVTTPHFLLNIRTKIFSRKIHHLVKFQHHIAMTIDFMLMSLPISFKTSWFTSVKKIGEALSTPIDLLVNSKVLLNKRLNESIERSWHLKKTL